MAALAIKSDFAILDVTAGRAKVRGALKKDQRIEVVIRGVLRMEWGDDDNVSQEFTVEVTSLTAKVKS